MKILYGIMAYRNDTTFIYNNIIQKLPITADDILMITMETPVQIDGALIEKAESRCANNRNQFIRKAKSLNCEKVIIIEDDQIILDSAIFEKMYNCMSIYNQDVMTFGYGSYKNRELGLPNPAIKILYKNVPVVNLTRYASSSVTIIKINESTLEYDEALSGLEHEFYMWDNVKNNKVSTYGFFYEPVDSWKYIKRASFSRLRKTTQNDFENDKNQRSEFYKFESYCETILNTIQKLAEEKYGLVEQNITSQAITPLKQDKTWSV